MSLDRLFRGTTAHWLANWPCIAPKTLDTNTLSEHRLGAAIARGHQYPQFTQLTSPAYERDRAVLLALLLTTYGSRGHCQPTTLQTVSADLPCDPISMRVPTFFTLSEWLVATTSCAKHMQALPKGC